MKFKKFDLGWLYKSIYLGVEYNLVRAELKLYFFWTLSVKFRDLDDTFYQV